jgi:type IV fimbrial biogenesis protein FimT
MHSNRRSRAFGFTLIECSVALAVAAISIGIAAPNFRQLTDRKCLEGSAAQLETDIQYSRSLAVALDQSVRISFTADVAMACYVIHTGGANACHCNARGETVCSDGSTALRTVAFGPDAAVTVSSNSRSILLDATNGTVTPTATMRVSNRSGKTLKVIANVMGRVRTCAATPGLPGYRRC